MRIFIFMLPIAGQMAGPIGLKFVGDTNGCRVEAKNRILKKKLFKNFLFFHGQRRAFQLV